MFLTPEQTGGPLVFPLLRQHNRYLAVEPGDETVCLAVMKWTRGAARGGRIQVFDIEQLAQTLGRKAGGTWQEHASLILLACCGRGLFRWLE